MDKKWLIGCGGCLGVVLILVIAGAGLLWWGGSAVMETAQKGSSDFFGGELPPGYSTLMSLPLDAQGSSMSFLMNMTEGTALVAINMPMTEEQRQFMVSGNTEELEATIQEAMASSNTSGDVKNMQLEGTVPLQTPGGQVVAMRFKLESEKGFTPVVVGLIPVSDDRLKVLMLMNPRTMSASASADFSQEYEEMTSDLESIIQNTDVAQNVIPIQPAG